MNICTTHFLLGPCPKNEQCLTDYKQCMRTCDAYLEDLKESFPEYAKFECDFKIHTNNRLTSLYPLEVVITYNQESADSYQFAQECSENLPVHWSLKARARLGIIPNIGKTSLFLSMFDADSDTKPVFVQVGDNIYPVVDLTTLNMNGVKDDQQPVLMIGK